MTDQFAITTKKRQSSSKLKRDLSSGQFASVSPLTDADLMDQCVRWVRAIDELKPLLQISASRRKPATDEDKFEIVGAQFLAAYASALRNTLLDQMALEDKQAVRDATKPLLTARRRSPHSLSAQVKGGES